MVVQHNISAMTANRYYGVNNKGLASSLEKLASGYAINKAGDNAAGLAVSEKMRAQIGGLTQASKNAEDGISLVQTFEGALQETDSILQRMRTLAVQSANGSYQNEVDRDAIQLEYDQLNDELNQIADTDYNGVVMLNGGVMADGTVANDPSKIAKRPDIEDVKTSPDATFTYKSIANGTVDGSGSGTLSINGVSIKLDKGNGTATLGDAANGTSVYSAAVTITNGAVNGKITASETYKIDDSTSEITIHGTSYKLSEGELKDSKGNTVTLVDGLAVGVKSDRVTLTGTYNVANSKISSYTTFTQANAPSDKTQAGATSPATTTVGGSLDADLNGAISINGASLKVKAGDSDPTTGVTTADGVNYKISSTFTNTNGLIEGEIKASGSQDYTTGVAKTGAGFVGTNETATKDAAYATNGKSTIEINGQTLVGVTTAGTTSFFESDGTTALADDDAISAYISKGNGGKYNYTVTTGADTGNGFTASYTSTEDYITVNGTKYNVNAASDGTNAAGTKIFADNADTTGATTYVTSKGLEITAATTKATFDATYKINQQADSVPQEMGEFKFSEGVSTSDAYNHGTRNLTFADSLTLQVGARGKDAVNFNFSYTTNGIGTLKSDMNASARGLGTDQLSLKSQEEANFAIDQIDNAINKVNMIRATFGAVQNRLEHKINNIDTNTENLTAAESRIRDTQMDKEMMKFTSSQILSQASQSMLAQANQLPQGVLQLLG